MRLCEACQTMYAGDDATCWKCGQVTSSPRQPLGERKMEICRTQCARYDAATDTCGVLTAIGMPGLVSYLASHPWLRCVDRANPKF